MASEIIWFQEDEKFSSTNAIFFLCQVNFATRLFYLLQHGVELKVFGLHWADTVSNFWQLTLVELRARSSSLAEWYDREKKLRNEERQKKKISVQQVSSQPLLDQLVAKIII